MLLLIAGEEQRFENES